MTAPKLGTRKWSETRARILIRDLYRCRYGYPGCTGEATEVDHVHPRQWGGSWWDPANLLSTCHSCHREKERRQRNGEALGVFLGGNAAETRPVSRLSPPISGDYSRKKASGG